jgi:hypothetical protein
VQQSQHIWEPVGLFSKSVRNYQAVSSPQGFSRRCDADGGSVRVGNYALYTCTVIYTVYSLPFVESTAVQMYMFMLKSV